ncbi:tetratricopeptide repeat protein [Asticcacaulis benevestitus]|uniref:Sel1 repeat family protein n=1 Tax=Asticcacaulis benevestitus DSM 16100 = ATCC BAA-896 TaxID=1121022 RepID=V4RBK1_9CAUL|nr:tetratricopeptide repeat protein [Asticcacaulis benevestitus]ESQ88803.1 hypothetical protein ABENE_14945 [Asticcacaulis benevestitus DSM 16100 = ATCC BAA-896]
MFRQICAIGCLVTSVYGGTALPAFADRVWHEKPVYRSVEPLCGAHEMSPKKLLDLSSYSLSTKEAGAIENSYVCVIRSALQGYAPAQARLGELYRLDPEGLSGGSIRGIVNDPDAALYWLKLASDAGEARASFLLGQMYELGEGTLQSDTEAAACYRLAARQGMGFAIHIVHELENRPQRVALFEARYDAKVSSGDADALLAYARAYLGGGPFIYDATKAASYVQTAADKGDARAQAMLGVMSLRGLGVSRDLEAATAWIIRAAKGGNHNEDWRLYWLHDDADLTQASIAVIEQASDEGLLRDRAVTSDKLDIVANANREPGSRVTPAMNDLSFPALMKIADSGDAGAQVNLGGRYLDGVGVAPDATVAKTWFLRAAAQNADANMILGDMAYTASPSDAVAALQYYTTAAVMGDPVGAKNAMTLYAKGGDRSKAYAMAIALDDLKARLGPLGVPSSLSKLSAEERAKALQFLCEQRLAHHR